MKWPLRLALIVVGSAAYFGLAVLGLGGLQPLFADPALSALAGAFLVMVAAAWFAGGNLSPGVQEDRGNRWVITVFTVLGFVDGYLPALTDRLNFWTIDGDISRWVGVAVFALGGFLRLWPVYVLGDRFSGLVAIQSGHKLITTGIYGMIRHPSYLGLLLLLLGWALAFRSSVGIIIAFLIALPLLARIRSEEKLLAVHFGREYEEYRARTPWKLLPGVY